MNSLFNDRFAMLLRTGCVALVLLASGCGKGKGDISISSSPAGAQVSVNGAVRGITPIDLQNLAPGQYVIELRKEGYDTVYKAVALLDKQELDVEIEMELTKGLLLVESQPPNADVVIDGVSKGKTPLLLVELPLGTYKLDFRSATHLPCTMEVELVNRKPVRVMAEMISNSARLVVDSEPEGAEVRINGVVRGSTPVTLEDVVAGKTDIKVALTGYSSYSRQMDLEPTRTYEIKAELEAMPSGVEVVTMPEGASVVIDNQTMGTTPLAVNLKDGAHEVEISLMGYETVLTNLVLQPDETQRLDLDLVKNSGTLVIDTEPASVGIYVDGTLVATTEPRDGADSLSMPVNILLKAGESHRIQLVREGYVASSFTLETELDQITTRHEVLRRIFVRDTMITTTTEVIKCRMEYKLPNGNIYYERFPGVYDTALASEIVSVQSIGLEDESNLEARRLLEQNRRIVP